MKFYLLSIDELAFLTSNARTYQDSEVVLATGHQLSKIPPRFYVDKVQENLVCALRDADVSYNSHNKKINRRNCAKVNELSAQGFDICYIHREDRTGYKAGALENGHWK